MSFLKKLAQSGLAQNASNIAKAKLNEALTPRDTQAPPVHQQQAPPQTTQVQQQAPRQGGGLVEGALAGLIGSAERFIENAGRVFGVCPNCHTAGMANTACEECGAIVQAATAQNQEALAAAAAARPSNCGNCGASVKGVICEYCDSRV